jgi:hypothetical protein
MRRTVLISFLVLLVANFMPSRSEGQTSYILYPPGGLPGGSYATLEECGQAREKAGNTGVCVMKPTKRNAGQQQSLAPNQEAVSSARRAQEAQEEREGQRNFAQQQICQGLRRLMCYQGDDNCSANMSRDECERFIRTRDDCLARGWWPNVCTVPRFVNPYR